MGVSLGDTKHEQHRLVAGQIKELLTDIPLQGGSFVEDSHFILRVTAPQAHMLAWRVSAQGRRSGLRALAHSFVRVHPHCALCRHAATSGISPFAGHSARQALHSSLKRW